MGDGLIAVAAGLLAVLYTGWSLSRGSGNGHTAVLLLLGICFVVWGVWTAIGSLL